MLRDVSRDQSRQRYVERCQDISRRDIHQSR
jgi:hypothetical protein